MIKQKDIVEIFSESSYEETNIQDVFIVLKNSDGNIFGYLPYSNYFMSLSKEEKQDYKNGLFDEKFTTLSYEQYQQLI